MAAKKPKLHENHPILSLQDAIELLTGDKSGPLADLRPGDSASNGKANFGLWFRGHSSSTHKLSASVTRDPIQYEETGMYHSFRLRNAQHGANYESPFDWLSLMQHYFTPTRLLDWTESVLTALYFATADERSDGSDGALIVLNARRLNYRGSCASRSDVAVPNSLDVMLRAALATERTLGDVLDFMRRPNVQQQIDDSIIEQKEILDKIQARDNDILSRLARPIAVLPKRQNPRMIAQSAVFTIEGGKMYLPNARVRDEVRPPKSVTIDTIPPGKRRLPIFKSFTIPSVAKPVIRGQLQSLGIDASVLFPELEYQSDYVRRQWRWVFNPQDPDEDEDE